jgi:hypothetical protein
MSGINWFFDTNAVISLLKGNSAIEHKLKEANWIGISVISVIEFLSFSNLTESDNELFNTFLERVEVIPLPYNLLFLKRIATLKAKTKLKIPDVVIAQCAIENDATLITNDADFNKVVNLKTMAF